jgi:hypothetical protein
LTHFNKIYTKKVMTLAVISYTLISGCALPNAPVGLSLAKLTRYQGFKGELRCRHIKNLMIYRYNLIP